MFERAAVAMPGPLLKRSLGVDGSAVKGAKGLEGQLLQRLAKLLDGLAVSEDEGEHPAAFGMLRLISISGGVVIEETNRQTVLGYEEPGASEVSI